MSGDLRGYLITLVHNGEIKLLLHSRMKPVHEVHAFAKRSDDGRYVGYVEHHINGGRQPEIETRSAGKFDTETEAFSAALDLAKQIEPSYENVSTPKTLR